MHFDQADLLAATPTQGTGCPARCPGKMIDRLFDYAAAGTHAHDHALGVGCADVVEQVVVPAEQSGELVHRLLHDARTGVVELVAGLAGLEEDVGVLGRAAESGIFGRERPGTVGGDQIHVDHLRHLRVGQLLDLVHFMRDAEAVVEVQERQAGLERRRVGNEGHVLRLLDRIRREHRPAGAAAGHHVAMVAKNGEGVRGDGAGGDVKNRRGQFPGDLEHVGDHQQETLRRREGGRQGPGLQRAVDRAGGPRFTLHFYDTGHSAENVLSAGGRPSVGHLTQVR